MFKTVMVIAMLLSGTAYADEHRGHYGDFGHHPYMGWHGSNDVCSAIVGGFIGGAISNWFTSPPPVIIVQPSPPTVPEPWSAGWYEFCTRAFQSFDPKSGFYTGFDGLKHFCLVRE